MITYEWYLGMTDLEYCMTGILLEFNTFVPGFLYDTCHLDLKYLRIPSELWNSQNIWRRFVVGFDQHFSIKYFVKINFLRAILPK